MNRIAVALALAATSMMPRFREESPYGNGWAGRCKGRAWGRNDAIAKAKQVDRRRRLRKENKNPCT